ncbi:MAG: tRNA adenosine(34) deaminase TadA [Deltaproteobacteria bacterium]|nr:tRNA adenosine(34) deaminase TadA [Deltaproteobacteria bacterium]
MTDSIERDEFFMREALAQAALAQARGEVPVGAVIVEDRGAIVARAHNLRELLDDPTAHAELLALRALSMDRKSWRLDDVTVYVTLEPCPMCAGALVNARVKRVVWGCDDPKAGAVRSLYSIGDDPRLNHRFACTSDILVEECSQILQRFFKALRDRKRRAP